MTTDPTKPAEAGNRDELLRQVEEALSAKFGAKLDTLTQENQQLRERLARAEGVMSARPDPDEGLFYYGRPQSERDWKVEYDLAVAQANADPDDVDASQKVQRIQASYQRWANEVNQSRYERGRAFDRLNDLLKVSGFEAESPEAKLAKRAFESGASVEEIEAAYIRPLKSAIGRATDDAVKGAAPDTDGLGRAVGSDLSGKPPPAPDKPTGGQPPANPYRRRLSTLEALFGRKVAPDSE